MTATNNKAKNAHLQISNRKHNKKTLALVLEAFLTSPYADDCNTRTDAIVLFNHIKKMI